MKYRDTVTAEESAQLLAEVELMDAYYAKAAEYDASRKQPESVEEAEAAEEQSLDYFNRYIAGDR